MAIQESETAYVEAHRHAQESYMEASYRRTYDLLMKDWQAGIITNEGLAYMGWYQTFRPFQHQNQIR